MTIGYKLVCRQSNKFLDRIDSCLWEYIVRNTKEPFYKSGAFRGMYVSTHLEYREALNRIDKFELFRYLSGKGGVLDFTARLYSRTIEGRSLDATETFCFRIVANDGIYEVYDIKRPVRANPEELADVTPEGKSEWDVVKEFLQEAAEYPYTFDDLRAALDKAESQWHSIRVLKDGLRLMLNPQDGECYVVDRK